MGSGQRVREDKKSASTRKNEEQRRGGSEIMFDGVTVVSIGWDGDE